MNMGAVNIATGNAVVGQQTLDGIRPAREWWAELGGAS